jgi:hypothetical protein
MMEVQRDWITANASFAELFFLLSVTVEVIKCLVPAADQTERLIVFCCDWAPLNAPDWGLELYFVFLIEISASE